MSQYVAVCRLSYGCETFLDSKIHNRSSSARLFSWFADFCKFRFYFRFDVHSVILMPVQHQTH